MIFNYIIAILATYRLAQLISIDEGPFFMFEKLRLKSVIKEADENDKEKKFRLWQTISAILHCQYCSGIYAALFCYTLLMIDGPISFLILSVLAIAGGQAILLDIMNGLPGRQRWEDEYE